MLHLLGERRAVVLTGGLVTGALAARALIFYAGLVTILIALQSPLDWLADKLFWAHMVQHLLLIAVAAPLIVLGTALDVDLASTSAPAAPRAARTSIRSPYLAPLRALFGVLTGRPRLAVVQR